MIDRPIMDLALKVAQTSKSRKKVGALLIHKNKVITQGVNQDTKSHPIQARFAEMVGLSEKIYLHAEISALVRCRSEVDTIVVARLGGHNGDELRNARPCPICSLAIKEAGIENIYYTTDDGFLYQYLNNTTAENHV
jgi:tRNA(Arg) A34 adenosine deaminase TadA